MSPVVVPADDKKEVDGFIKETKKVIDRAFSDIAKSSNTKQLVFGTASGWFTGYIGMKVGKVAAVGLGSGIILLHLANQGGYVNINWDKIHKNVDNISEKIEKETNKRSSAWLDKIIEFMKTNSYYSAGFAGGVFFGIASS
ncbi:FUN14 domain-containing protein 1A-like [Arctopsyche grandis]|uniref:FUN14 domain-containing protein 1A-like n=1 Tax=Arctopsyche grandis TaxID=121162 RepID=UPI00406D9F69